MKLVTYHDKMLPTQPFFTSMADGKTDVLRVVEGFAASFSPAYVDLKLPKSGHLEELSTPPMQIALLAAIIQLRGCRTGLEIGTFIGHTTIRLAKVLDSIYTIESGAEFAAIARENFERNEVKNATLIEADAKIALCSLPPFDFIYIDGGKQDYLEYAVKCESMLTERGVLVIDDVFFHGDALNYEPTTDKGRGCKEVLEYYAVRHDIERLLLPLGNGMLIVWKK